MAARQVIMIVLLIILVAMAGCTTTEENDTQDKNSETNDPTDNGTRTIEQGSVTREYILHVPESYNSNIPTPLVINFHGFGDRASDFSKNIGDGYSNLNSVADNSNFLVAYPQGVVRKKEGAEWDPGDKRNSIISRE